MRASFVLASLLLTGVAATPVPATGARQTDSAQRMARIEQRGTLTCGIEAGVTGFVEVDRDGRYHGLDVDICRAIAAAILGSADKVTYIHTGNIAEFLRNDDIDVVSRRLTWELQRDGPLGIQFGPVTFYDGQTFLVAPAARAHSVSDLAGQPVCVAGGTVFEVTLTEYFRDHQLDLRVVPVDSPHAYDDVAAALSSGRCVAYSGDESDLGAIRTRLPRPAAFAILPLHISKEPLAPLMRDGDVAFIKVVRWTIFALISAEELGISHANAASMRASPLLDVRRLLGGIAGNGRALGLDEAWAYRAISAVGNYGEIFTRNVGSGSVVNLSRGLNQLQRDGGLMYAPPLR